MDQKHLKYSRAYIKFDGPEDVFEFAEFFSGHIFVNEKGAQYKAIVEYAPSQRVPKQWSKRDGREGTILKDPEYLKFLEFLSKPPENLPSAEIQLERKEAERAGAPNDVPIVTPLMEYVRQKRAAKRTLSNGKSTRRVTGISSRGAVSGSSKRGSEKKRASTTVYVLRDSSKGAGCKDKATYFLVPKQDDQQLEEKSAKVADISKNDALEGGSGSGSTGFVKKKILHLKGKEKEISNVSGGSSLQQNAASPAKNTHSSAPFRQNQQQETGGRIIRSILLSRNTRQNQPPCGSQSELQIHTLNGDRDKKPPQPPSMQSLQKETNGVPKDKVVSNDLLAVNTEKQERRAKNKDRPDRGVWTPLQHSDGSYASDDSLSSASMTSQTVDPAEDVKNELLFTGRGDCRHIASGRSSHYYVGNGSYRHGERHGSAYNLKYADGSSVIEGKPSKQGGYSGYGTRKKQVWVQKSSSGS